ncbi:MAG: VOC family protein [Chloroflexi bacterium]|nr:VOC family protein [Chloroflexota bacterium]
MEPRITVVTLGVRDLRRAVEFYHGGLGWPLSSASTTEVAFFRTSGVVLALYPRDLLAADANLPAGGSGFGGVTLAHNVASKAEADAAMARASAAGATTLKPAQDVFWGGYAGYFADPDGHVWEVAWNPHWPLAADGSIVLPE